MSVGVPPSVDALAKLLDDGLTPPPLLVAIARAATTGSEGASSPEVEGLRLLAALRASRLSRVVNASGVLLHTNLGRASWSERARLAAAAAAGYGNLEFDVNAGKRGQRGAYVGELLRVLTGAQEAMVVNNNAGGLLLTLAVLASGGSVPVSRGELIEIGGSYRLPDLMAASGARLVEVGTTNQTRLGDYEAVVDGAALLLKVHPSNYQITGFTGDASVLELASLARDRGIPLVFDIGSGLLDASTPWLEEHPPHWLVGEPGVRQALEQGADLVLFSGDKLLGGPQAGIIVGSGDLVGRLRASPLARALRVDGVTLAALAATLEAYASRRVHEIPFWRMATTPHEVLEERALEVVRLSGSACSIIEGASTVGGGSAPGAELPSPLIRLPGPAEDAFLALLKNDPPVLARRVEGHVVVDLRAVDVEDDPVVAGAIAAVCR